MQIKDQLGLVLGHFVGAMKGMVYYPSGHPAIIKPIEDSLAILSKIFSTKDEIVLGLVEETLVFDGHPFYQTNLSANNLINIIKGARLEKIIFKRGINATELIRFFELIQKDPNILKSEGGINKVLQKSNIIHISLEELPEELFVKSKEVYAEAKGVILDIMKEARVGKIPNGKEAIAITMEMTEILLTEKSALLGLTMLQGYDEYTFNHCVNVGIISLSLSQALEFDSDVVTTVGLAGLLHDIGKTFTPKEIILKPGKLTEEEWKVMQMHPLDGARIVKGMKELSPIPALIIYEHHAKFNLDGYPKLEKERKLHPGTKVVAIADCFDSMTTQRSYQKRFDPKEAIEIMKMKSGIDFDPEYLKKFVEMVGIYPIGSLVRLDTNEIAIVSRINKRDNTRPYIKIIYNSSGSELDEPMEVCLDDIDVETKKFKRNIVGTVEPVMAGLLDINKYFYPT